MTQELMNDMKRFIESYKVLSLRQVSDYFGIEYRMVATIRLAEFYIDKYKAFHKKWNNKRADKDYDKVKKLGYKSATEYINKNGVTKFKELWKKK